MRRRGVFGVGINKNLWLPDIISIAALKIECIHPLIVQYKGIYHCLWTSSDEFSEKGKVSHQGSAAVSPCSMLFNSLYTLIGINSLVYKGKARGVQHRAMLSYCLLLKHAIIQTYAKFKRLTTIKKNFLRICLGPLISLL